MKRFLGSLIVSFLVVPATSTPIRAYDIDCAIILCMAGGFPPSPVCNAAYAEMIRRITPWPVLPPFGVCHFAIVPTSLGGPGGRAKLDISLPEYAWLRRTKVYWFWGSKTTERGGFTTWAWYVQTCDHQNTGCRISIEGRTNHPWPATFISENGQTLPYPMAGPGDFSIQGVLIEFGDYSGIMDRSEWYLY